MYTPVPGQWKGRNRLRLALACLLVLVSGPASAQTPDAPVDVDRAGWWNRANGAEGDLVDDPIGLPQIPKPPTVPAGAVAVSAAVGEADKVAALGFPELPATPGATVDAFVLTLRESAEPGASTNASAALVVACPVTTFWVEGENGEWGNRPEADCDTAKVQGARGEDGTWTFDLAPIAALWLDPFGTIRQDGVLLQPDVTPPAPSAFQVSFEDPAGEGSQVVFSATGGAEAEDPFATDGLGGSVGTGASNGGFSTGTGGGSFATGGAATPLPPPAVPTPERPPATPETAAPRVTDAPGIFDALPAGALLLVPMALGMAVVMALALGPAGDPGRATRQGGVSRALARRERPSATARPTPSATPALEGS